MSAMRCGRVFGLVAICAALIAADAVALHAQGRGRRERVRADDLPPNPLYDGRWTFVRLKYEMSLDGFGGGRFGRDLPWAHDFPDADRNFPQILGEISTVLTRPAKSVILGLSDPDLFKYPVAYMSEPGYWRPSDIEVAAMRAYFLKGGFVIFDDFAGRDWLNFEQQMRRVLPEHRLIPLTAEHPVFDSFYRIASLDYTHPYYGVKAEFWGIFEDNDPTKRLMAVANYNNDIGDYWEYSATGFFPVDLSNEAYKLGVNYVVYALTR
jgi:hypothetical protein